MRVAIKKTHPGAPPPCLAVVLDASGEDISRRYLITAADDETGTFTAWADKSGALVSHADHQLADHLSTVKSPGLKITDSAGPPRGRTENAGRRRSQAGPHGDRSQP